MTEFSQTADYHSLIMSRLTRVGLFRLGISVSVTSLILTSAGCGSVGVFLGLRTRLDKVDIASLSVALAPGPSIGLGKTAKLIMVATTKDNKKLTSVGAGKDTVLMDSFTGPAQVVSVGKKWRGISIG